MTLNTSIYILDPTNVREVFEFGQGLLATRDEQARPVAMQEWHERESWRDDGSRMLGNRLGQGLPAILEVLFRPDAPLVSPEQAQTCGEDCLAEGHSPSWHRQACALEVTFDTGYAYKVDGRGCGDLHAELVAEFGQWLDSRGLRWRWENEFTGEVFDRFDGLDTLLTEGARAAEWFQTTALTAILGHAHAGAKE